MYVQFLIAHSCTVTAFTLWFSCFIICLLPLGEIKMYIKLVPCPIAGCCHLANLSSPNSAISVPLTGIFWKFYNDISNNFASKLQTQAETREPRGYLSANSRNFCYYIFPPYNLLAKGHIQLFQPDANLAANLVFDQVYSQVFDKFVRVCNMLSTRFRLFLSKTWSRTCCINLDMSRLMQQVRWFVRVLDKWNVEKNPFRASQRTC